MKKITLLFVLLTSFSMVGAQVFLNEDFSDGSMPPENWTISAEATNWSVVSTANAGGGAPEGRFTWTPQFTGQSYLISPSMDLSGNDSGILMISFRHALDHYGGTYSVGFAVRSDGGAWQTLWDVVNPTGDIAAQEVSLNLDSDIVTSDDFQLAFFFSGNSFNLNHWYIDDILVLVPQDFDLALSSLDVPDIVGPATPVKGYVGNFGNDVIDSFDLNWQLDDGEVFTTSFTDLDLAFGEQFYFEADDLIDAEPGSYELTVFISNMNGAETDDNPDNDSITKNIAVVHGNVVRRPLFEMFTSSTCPPCATVNNGFFNNFTDTNADDIVLIKYQMNWPGSGDPYYTPEGGIRRNYYGVSGVPSIFLEGENVPNSLNAVTNGLQTALTQPAFVDITGNFVIDGTTIQIDGSLMPFADIPSARLHVVVIESVTYGNTGTNGETFFKHVMHKMLPNAQGTTVDLTALEAYHFDHSFDMASTNVEEMDDLMVAVFLQNHATKEIYQSAYMSSGSIVTFNITDGATDVEPDAQIEAYFVEPVEFMDGTEINDDNVADLISFYVDGDEADVVDFNATVNEEKNMITIVPFAYLDFLTTYTIAIETVMGESGMEAEGNQVTFTTRDTYGTPVVSFDLEDGAVDVPVDHNIVITTNQQVRHPEDGSELTPGALQELIHFSEQDAAGEPVPFSVTINEAHTEFLITPDDMLLYNTHYFVEMGALMGVDGQISEPQAITFNTEIDVIVTETEMPGMNLYPNPVFDVLRLEIHNMKGQVKGRIFNASGMLVSTFALDSGETQIDVSELAEGIYLLEIISGNTKLFERFTKIK